MQDQNGKASGLYQNNQRSKKEDDYENHCKMPSQVLTLSFWW